MPARVTGVLTTLRQPRYAALGVLMLVVALVCVGCGVWQIFRYENKHDDNEHLRRNAELAVTTPAAVLPVLGRGSAPSRDDVEFRQVQVTGRYDAANETLVRNRTDGDDTGFLVLTPLRTSGPTLLVVRGFVAQPTSGAIPPAPAPPAGTVTIVARAQQPETRGDQFRELTQRQVRSINPAEQAARIGGAFYDGYAQLEGGQPGSEGLRVLPRPDLSNPAGGALEPQHFAYVIQWFLFAALAIAAPFVMARAENKRRDDGEFDEDFDQGLARTLDPSLDSDVPAAEKISESDHDDRRAAKLADRYGRPIH